MHQKQTKNAEASFYPVIYDIYLNINIKSILGNEESRRHHALITWNYSDEQPCQSHQLVTSGSLARQTGNPWYEAEHSLGHWEDSREEVSSIQSTPVHATEVHSRDLHQDSLWVGTMDNLARAGNRHVLVSLTGTPSHID